MNEEKVLKNCLLFHKVQKFISDFPDLKYDGSRVWCLVCKRDLMCWKRSQCQKHLESANHKYKKSGQNSHAEFLIDLTFMLSACNMPLYTIQKEPFRNFWKIYNPNWKLPCDSTLRNYLPCVRERMENTIRREVNSKKLWLTINKSMDSKKNSVVNVVVRTLNPCGSSPPYLIASKRLPTCTDESVVNLVVTTLEKFDITANQVLMFVTNDRSSMLCVGRLLKHICPTLIHVICALHVLHLVVETICHCYPDVNALIVHGKAVFVKSPKRIRQFHEKCPNIPELPQPVTTQWETWLEAAFYYHQHFQQLRALVLQFDAKEDPSIKASQLKFQDPQVEADLQTIFNNYQEITHAITALQKSSLSLVDSLHIVDNLQTVLETLSDEKSVPVKEKFISVQQDNADFFRLRQIYNNNIPSDPLSCLKDYFNYANITSLDVERSFSLYKNIFSPLRINLKETTVETYAMLQMFSRTHSDL